MIVHKGDRFTKPKTPERFYIDKSEFLLLLVEYKKTGKVNNQLGEMLLLLAKQIASANNFKNYPDIDEWMQEGVLTCLKYMHNFDPFKQDGNAFGYFSQIIIRTFLVKIKLEKASLEFKKKISKYDANGYIIEENNIYSSLDENDTTSDYD